MKRFKLTITLLLLSATLLTAQTRTGIVRDDKGEPLPGVSVGVEGKNVGTVTDVDGKFSISAENSDRLTFSFVGMMDKTITVSSANDLGTITMGVDVEQLGEVVVTALGIKREQKALGYSITSVKSSELAAGVGESNVASNLSGRVAGVHTIRSTAGPGSSILVTIRGSSSLSGTNQPLYVIDGIPVTNFGQGSSSGSGTDEWNKDDFGQGATDINSEDIESITVLKGPNASALYGSRASNGVILITTKRGTSKGLGIQVSSSTLFDAPFILPKFQNEYGRGVSGVASSAQNLLNESSSWGGKLDGSQKSSWIGGQLPYSPQPNNVKDFFALGKTFVNSVTISNGGDRGTFLMSYTNRDVSSIIPNSNLSSHNINLRVSRKLGAANTPWGEVFSVDAKVTLFNQTYKNRIMQGNTPDNPILSLYSMPRNLRLDDLKNKYTNEEGMVPYTNSIVNQPYWVTNKNSRNDIRTRLLGFSKINVRFTDYLSAFARIGLDYSNFDRTSYTPYGDAWRKAGLYEAGLHSISEINSDFLLMFNKEIVPKIGVIANFGGNMAYRETNSSGHSGETERVAGKYFLSNYVKQTSSKGLPVKKQINSLYGTLSIAYDSWAYFDVSYRNDWSSTLPSHNWSYSYPSFSLSILLSQALRLNKDLFPYIKVRGSYALVGSDTDPYQLVSGYRVQSESYDGATVFGKDAVKRNPDLKPEITTSQEYGLEFKLMKNRIYGEFTFYNIETKDQIINVPVSSTTGFASFLDNAGTVINRGIEVLIGGRPIQTDFLSWDISLNYSTNHNELKEFYKDIQQYVFTNSNDGNFRVVANPGGVYGELWGKEWKKINGKYVVDANGAPVESDELVKLGSYLPDYRIGITNSFKIFNDISLSFLIDGRVGGKLFNKTQALMDAAGTSERSLEHRTPFLIENSVQVDKDGNVSKNTQKISPAGYYSAINTIPAMNMVSATNFRLKQLSVSYSIPTELLKSYRIKKLTISFLANNLFFIYNTIDGFDPESAHSVTNFSQGWLYYTLPSVRSLGFSVKLHF